MLSKRYTLLRMSGPDVEPTVGTWVRLHASDWRPGRIVETTHDMDPELIHYGWGDAISEGVGSLTRRHWDAGNYEILERKTTT